jgi:hypothetical protein
MSTVLSNCSPRLRDPMLGAAQLGTTRTVAGRTGRITCAHGSLTMANKLSGPNAPRPLPGRLGGQIFQSLATEVQSCNHRGTLVFGQSRASMHTEHHHSILQCYHRAEVVQANLREPRPSASMPAVFGRRKASLVNSTCRRSGWYSRYM